MAILTVVCASGCARGQPTVTRSTSPPQEIVSWRYRFGDSPRDASGTPTWVSESSSGPEWKTLALPGFPPKEARAGHHFLWMRARLPKYHLRDPALRIDPVLTHLEVWLDGARVRGPPDLDQAQPPAVGIPWHLLQLPVDGAEHQIALRIRSDYALIGIQGHVVVAERADHLRWVLSRDAGRLILGSLMGLMALFALAFARRRQDRRLSLSFAAFAICTGVYVVRYSHIKDLLYDAPLVWFDTTMISFALLGWTLLGFVVALFPRAPSVVRWLWRAQGAFAILFIVSGFTFGTRGSNVMPMAVQSGAVLVLRLFNLLAAVAGLVVGFAEVRRRNREAGLFLVGFMLYHVALVRDILAAQGLIEFSLNTFSHWGMMLTTVCLGLIVQRRYVARIQEYAQELGARSKERELMLADLHDGIGGITTNIRLLSEAAQRADSPERARETLAAINRLARDGIGEIRSVMQGLDEEELDWAALAAELRALASGMLEPHSLSLTLETDIDPEEPPPDLLTGNQVRRIFREALTNVLKHSSASRLEARIRVADGLFTLELENDGVGEGERGVGVDLGRGVEGMRTRAAHLGGNVEISLGETAVLKLELPTERRSEHPA